MGYRSEDHGTFTLRHGVNEKEAIDSLKDNYFICDKYNNPKSNTAEYILSFNELKMYYAGEIMKKLAKYFNGVFEITGEEPYDLWKLILREGKAYTVTGRVEYGPEEETDLNGPEWN